VVALDCRGHGRSGKPHHPEAYGGTKMPDDVMRLMDHLGIAEADLAGYSMGGFISASLLVRHPERFRSVILAGVGGALASGSGRREGSDEIARALEAPPGERPENATARGFRAFAEQSGNDLQAMAAIMRSTREGFPAGGLAGVTRPVAVIVGEGDTLVGPGEKLAAAIPGARHVKVPGDHITAVGQPEFRRAILEFLRETSPVPAR